MAARSLAVIGNLRGMSPEFLRALYFTKYGVSLGVGIGVPIPILDEALMRSVTMTDAEIFAPVLDYGVQSRARRSLMEVSYQDLKSGSIAINGKDVRTSSLSSYRKAREIATILRDWIRKGEFLLTAPVELMPDERGQKPLDAHANWELV